MLFMLFASCTHIMSPVVNDGVVRQVGGHQQCVDVFGPKALHIGLSEVRVEIPRKVVVAGCKLES